MAHCGIMPFFVQLQIFAASYVWHLCLNSLHLRLNLCNFVWSNTDFLRIFILSNEFLECFLLNPDRKNLTNSSITWVLRASTLNLKLKVCPYVNDTCFSQTMAHVDAKVDIKMIDILISDTIPISVLSIISS